MKNVINYLLLFQKVMLLLMVKLQERWILKHGGLLAAPWQKTKTYLLYPVIGLLEVMALSVNTH